jgi:hypothetical protein
MKIRLGFVPNSSSSSFTCEVCGRSECGMDASPSDFDMIICFNGHTVCISEVVEDYPNDTECYEMEEKYCPICSFITFGNGDLCQYLLKLYGVSRDEVFEEVKKLNPRRKKLYDPEYIMYVCTKKEINRDELLNSVKTRFSTYKEFRNFINEK